MFLEEIFRFRKQMLRCEWKILHFISYTFVTYLVNNFCESLIIISNMVRLRFIPWLTIVLPGSHDKKEDLFNLAWLFLKCLLESSIVFQKNVPICWKRCHHYNNLWITIAVKSSSYFLLPFAEETSYLLFWVLLENDLFDMIQWYRIFGKEINRKCKCEITLWDRIL